MIIQNKQKKTVISGLMLALGIILPFACAHGFGMSGNIILPMHIPVLMCGFLCGPLYGAVCGLILPFLNSLLTGMPAMFPMAVIMTCELGIYGLVSGILSKKSVGRCSVATVYGILIAAMISGRLAYGLALKVLLFSGAPVGKMSVIAAVVTGLPGIVIQLVLIPAVILRVARSYSAEDACKIAVKKINDGKATCITVRNGREETVGNSRGIAYVLDLCEKGMLKDAFVADKVVGKAAAMVFTHGGISGCYAQNISDGALLWLNSHNVPVEYTNRSPYIVNRKGDGMCPMELTVSDISDEAEAINALKKKIDELGRKNPEK